MAGKTHLNNPFVTTGYVAPAYFCDRETESRQMLEAIHAHRNMALISLRRMGKTGLLKHVRYLLSRQSRHHGVIYIDLMPTRNASDFLSMLGTALMLEKHREKNIIEKIVAALSSLRPGISYDTLSGQPSLVFSVVSENDFHFGLRQLLVLFASVRKELTIVLDEFQQILGYPENNTEHLLRTVVQENPQITFILSGSDKHMMEAMFSSPARPFFQSVEMMYLGPIDREKYSAFIRNHFHSAGIDIPEKSVNRLQEWCRYHTFYVQHFCNRLYAKEFPKIDDAQISETSLEILSSFEPLFLSFRKLLTAHQFSLIQAIAVENGVSKPLSGDFIRKHDLKSASSVKTSLDALAGKEMLIRNEDTWQVYDVFFARWLEHTWKMLNL